MTQAYVIVDRHTGAVVGHADTFQQAHVRANALGVAYGGTDYAVTRLGPSAYRADALTLKSYALELFHKHGDATNAELCRRCAITVIGYGC